MKRELVGKGHEHFVYGSKNPGFVLKKPNSFFCALVNLYAFSRNQSAAELIRSDIDESRSRLAPEDGEIVKIPRTLVFSSGKGYVIFQERVFRGGARLPVSEISSPLVRAIYESKPDNFICNNGTIYWIDPIKGLFTWVPLSLGVSDWEGIESFKVKVKRRFRAFLRYTLRYTPGV